MGAAVDLPFFTTRRMRSSSAIIQSTSTALEPMPPPAIGSGASRVQSTKPSGVGSPDMTPKENGYFEKLGAAYTVEASAAPRNKKSLRLRCMGSIVAQNLLSCGVTIRAAPVRYPEVQRRIQWLLLTS